MVRPLVLALCFFFGLADAQQPGVTIKVKESSGFLGMGPPLYAHVVLDNEPGEYPLTSANVNAGPHYFFLVRSAGGWVPNEDFVKNRLPGLSIRQGEQRYLIGWLGELNSADSSVLVGFPKDLRLHQPLTVQFQLGEELLEDTFTVPMELWPGYDRFIQLEQQLSAAVAAGSQEQAVAMYETILGDVSLEIFPSYAGMRQGRTAAFRSYLEARNRRVEDIRLSTSAALTDRIQQLSAVKPEYRFVTEGLVKPSLGISAEDPDVAALLRECTESTARIGALRDSLERALESERTAWIIDGGATGRMGFLYQYMIEALAHAFASLDFTDTSGTDMTMRLPPVQQDRLAKQKLTESYETFLRLAVERHRRGEALFPDVFLNNLERDSAVFTLPYHAMLRAVQEYYSGTPEDARRWIFSVFRTSYDPALNGRFDEMRVMIDLRTGRQPGAALGLIQEALAEERGGNVEGAGERFRQATAVAPDLAYAAFMLGRYYDRRNDPIRALPFLQRAYDLDTLYFSAYREAAQIFQKSGTFKPMIEVLTKALARGNQYWEIEYTLGLASAGDGKLEDAVRHFQQALDINPRSYDANIQLGLAYQSLSDYPKAREYYNSAINIDPLRQTAVDLLTRLNELQRAPQ